MYGSVRSDEPPTRTRRCTKSYTELAAETGLHRDTIRKDIVPELLRMGILAEASAFDAQSHQARMYDVLSFGGIRELWRKAGITHFIPGRKPVLCNAAGEKLAILGPPGGLTPPDIPGGLGPPEVLSPPGSGGLTPPDPGGLRPSLSYKAFKGKLQEDTTTTTVSTNVLQALRDVAGEATDEMALAIVHACRQIRDDAKDYEIAYFIRHKGARASGIANMSGFLLKQVPKHFEGRAFELYRAENTHRIHSLFETQRQAIEETRRICNDILNSDIADESDKSWAKQRLSEMDQELGRINAEQEKAINGE